MFAKSYFVFSTTRGYTNSHSWFFRRNGGCNISDSANGGITFVFAVIPKAKAKGVDLLNAPAHSKFMMHLTDRSGKAVSMSKFSIEHIIYFWIYFVAATAMWICVPLFLAGYSMRILSRQVAKLEEVTLQDNIDEQNSDGESIIVTDSVLNPKERAHERKKVK